MDHKSPIELACGAVGGASKLADLLGVSVQVVGNWKVRGVPIERCVAIENATGGAVTRRDLCPDWEKVWPELAKKPARAQ